MERYVPSVDHDLALLRWWNDLVVSQTFGEAFAPSFAPPSVFLDQFQSPATLYLLRDAGVVMAAVWTWPTGYAEGAFVAVWGHPTIRHQKRGIGFLRLAFATALEDYRSLIAVTRHTRVAGILPKLGFVEATTMEEARMFVLTREAWRKAA